MSPTPAHDRPNRFPLINGVALTVAVVVLIVVMLKDHHPGIVIGAVVFLAAFWIFVGVAVNRDAFRPK